ncbi:claudin-10 [Nothobranchius furzeri]|uniref:Claudin-10-like n=1 Tax=Nothobranchius furzeri TaxID=105023 RepID=A0A9D3BQC8_NOTFU|nr:claudin-10 [Nothobranchius furzeri]KAF7214823.1 claudin-10-like [Nothobranchius furzeri]
MKYRTVVMYMEIGCFVSCLCGWILVCSTLPTEYWSFSEGSSVVMTTSNFYSNLWRDCISDTTGVSDCKDYPSLLALPGFLHSCRALAICAVITGFFGSVLTLIGMKCTKIGGTEIINSRVTFSGGVTYIFSGFCGMITYSWWANRIITEFVDPNFKKQKFELGAAIFVGWGGAILLIGGGAVLTFFSGKDGLQSRNPSNRTYGPASYVTARTKRTYMQPPSSRVTLVPPLNYSARIQTTRATTKTGHAYSRDTFV